MTAMAKRNPNRSGGARLSTRDMLARLIAIDTTSAKPNMPFVEAVADYLGGHGITARLVKNDAGDKANLFATVGPAGDGGIVLSGHSDVVPVAGQDWSSDPFAATARDGRIYGRGACDMKGFIAASLALVPEMIAAKLKTPIHLAFSYDEELGCIGIPHLLAEIAKSLPRPKLAIIGEPTSMRLVTGHKGICACETVVRGLEAHSSAPQIGVSAIVHGAEIIGFLDRLAREMAEHGPFNDAFTPPYTTFNVGLVEGGTAVNIIPRQCRIRWEFRPIPGVDPATLRGRLERFVADDLLPRMRERYPGAAVVTTVEAASPPLEPRADSPAEALVRMLTGANTSGAVSFSTEAGHFQHAGIPAAVIGPGSIEQAHKPDEFVEIAQLEECEAFLRKVIDYAAKTAP